MEHPDAEIEHSTIGRAEPLSSIDSPSTIKEDNKNPTNISAACMRIPASCARPSALSAEINAATLLTATGCSADFGMLLSTSEDPAAAYMRSNLVPIASCARDTALSADMDAESTATSRVADCAMLLSEDPALDFVLSSPPSLSPPGKTSLLPSSSPPGQTSSQPRSFCDTPPSSSPPLEGPCDVDCPPSMATQEEESASFSSTSKQVLNIDDTDDLHRSPKRRKADCSDHDLPHPTHPTSASEPKRFRKPAAPFRPPIIKGSLVQGGLNAVYTSGRPVSIVIYRQPTQEKKAERANPVNRSTLEANKDRTAKAARQFKSPVQLTSPSATTASKSNTVSVSRVKAIPTIQALQGQVQTLKQAIKIKHSGGEDEDEILEELVEKWTAVGREVAWALWHHVKDLDPGTGGQEHNDWFTDSDEVVAGRKRGFDTNCDYDDKPAQKKARIESDVEAESSEDMESPVVHHTIGIMLRRLGIDPNTLGWNEDEGDFIDM